MVNEKILYMKTGRLDPVFAKRGSIYILMFLAGVIFSVESGDLQGYIHEFGHVAAACITGGEGEIVNPHLCHVLYYHSFFGPFIFSSGVGFVFLFYYFLSSRRTLGRFLVFRAFFTGTMLMELQGSYYFGQSDFDQYPMAAVLFTLTWVYLLYRRIRVTFLNKEIR